MTTTNKVTHQQGVDSTASTNPTGHPPKRRAVLVWLMLLFLMIVGCFAYVVYCDAKWRKGAVQELHGLQTSVLTMDRTIKSLQTSQEKSRLVVEQVNKVIHEQSYQASDWMLLKARYYLELAQINGYWSNSTQVTSALLMQADKLLADIHEKQLFDVRRAIAEENTQVLAIETIDVTGLLGQLEAAQQLAQGLQAKPLPELAGDTTALESKTSSGWRKRLKDSLMGLEKLVVIRRVDEEIQPLVTPAYIALLRENVMLILQETQWAVLQHSEDLYQLTLKQAKRKIIQSFDTSEANTMALLKQLDVLATQSVVHKKSNVGQALVLLNQVIDSKQANTHEGAPTS